MTLKQLDTELSEINSIPKKLDYLAKFHLKLKGTLINEINSHKYEGNLSIYELAKRLSEKHFPNLDDDVGFSYWFLIWNAKWHLNNRILDDEYKRKLSSERKKDFIKGELSKLENKELNAYQKERDGLINSSYRYRANTDKHSIFYDRRYLFNENYKCIEILRIIEDNYYKSQTTEHAYNVSQSPEVKAYAYHILLKNHLLHLRDTKINSEPENSTEQPQKQLPKRQNQDLTQPQIALIYAYKNKPITRDNGSEIAREYGYTAKTSGQKLYQHFNKYYNANDRKNDEGSKRKNQSKIKHIERVIEFLPDELKARAKFEVETLKNITNTNYS